MRYPFLIAAIQLARPPSGLSRRARRRRWIGVSLYVCVFALTVLFALYMDLRAGGRFVLSVLFVVPSVWLVVRLVVRYRRYRQVAALVQDSRVLSKHSIVGGGICQHCGYEIAGLPTATGNTDRPVYRKTTCPECGTMLGATDGPAGAIHVESDQGEPREGGFDAIAPEPPT